MMFATGVAMAQAGVDRLGTWVAVIPGNPDPSDGHGPEWGKAAPAGLLIWLFMGVALFFLIRSMNRHIKRVPKSFDQAVVPTDGAGSEADAGADAGADTEVTESAADADAPSSEASPAEQVRADASDEVAAAREG